MPAARATRRSFCSKPPAKTSDRSAVLPDRRPTDALTIIPAAPDRITNTTSTTPTVTCGTSRTNKEAKNFRIVHRAPGRESLTGALDGVHPPPPAVKIDGMTSLPATRGRGAGRRAGGWGRGHGHRPRAPDRYPRAGLYPRLGPNPEFDTSTLRYTYQSMVTPPSVFDYD